MTLQDLLKRKLFINKHSAILVALCLLVVKTAMAQSPGGVSSSLTSWFKANTTNGTATTNNVVIPSTATNRVSQWKSENGAYTLSQTTTNQQPVYTALQNANASFNFNPFIQFSKANSTMLYNTATTPDLLGANGSVFVIINTYNTIAETNPSGFTYSSTNKYQFKPGFRIQTGNSTAGSTLDYYNWAPFPSGVPAYPTTAGIILMSKGVNTSAGSSVFRGRKNGDSISITNNYDAVYNPSISSGLYLGGNNGSELMSCAVAEIITFNTYLDEGAQNKIESYLAVKYGITLTQGQSTVNRNYTSPGNVVFWDATANAGYPFCVTGLGRDDASGLLQKQSKSASNNAIVSLYNDVTTIFPVTNIDNTTTITTDGSYFIIGDNGLPVTLTSCAYANKMPRLQRVWKVQKTGAGISNVTLAADATALPASVKNLLVSTTPNFLPGSTTVYPLDVASGKLYKSIQLNSGDYFTYASDSIIATFAATQPTCANPSSGSITSNITGGNTPYTYSWNTTPVQTTANATGLPAGAYTITITNIGGCAPVFATPAVIAPATITVAPTASQPAVCAASPVTLDAHLTGGTGGVVTYTWGPGTFANSATITDNPTVTTNYTVTAQDGGCTATGNVSVTISAIPTSNFTATAAVCLGDAASVAYVGSAGTGANYTWAYGDGGTASGQAPPPYTYAIAGPYTINLVVAENGCISPAFQQNLLVNTPPSTSFAISSTAICSGTNVDVSYLSTPSPTAVATWSWDGGNVVSGTAFGPYVLAYNSTANNIKLKVTDGACIRESAAQIVNVTPTPVATFSPDKSIGCPNPDLLINFANNSSNVSSATIYNWSYGDGATDNNFNGQHSYTTPSIYAVTLTATTGACTHSFGPVNIEVVKSPEANFSSSPLINTPTQLSQANFSFTNQSQFASSYKWGFGDNSFPVFTTNAQHKYQLVGNYAVMLIANNSAGCSDTVVHSYYQVIPDSTLKIPNVFSPNNDGVHDTWVIEGLKGYPDATVAVFNRWGQQVFTSLGYNTPWNGRFKNEQLSVGTYYYIIVANGKKYAGWVMVIR